MVIAVKQSSGSEISSVSSMDQGIQQRFSGVGITLENCMHMVTHET